MLNNDFDPGGVWDEDDVAYALTADKYLELLTGQAVTVVEFPASPEPPDNPNRWRPAKTGGKLPPLYKVWLDEDGEPIDPPTPASDMGAGAESTGWRKVPKYTAHDPRMKSAFEKVAKAWANQPESYDPMRRNDEKPAAPDPRTQTAEDYIRTWMHSQDAADILFGRGHFNSRSYWRQGRDSYGDWNAYGTMPGNMNESPDEPPPYTSSNPPPNFSTAYTPPEPPPANWNPYVRTPRPASVKDEAINDMTASLLEQLKDMLKKRNPKP